MLLTDLKVDKDGTLYVTKNVPENNPIFRVTLPANSKDLEQFELITEQRLELLNFVKIPWTKIVEVWSYFSAVYAKHSSEAIVLFHMDSETNEYTVVVPESYTASMASLSYDPNQVSFCPECRIASKSPAGSDCPRCPEPTKTVKLNTRGTMHSHGHMSAFHSSTDDDHEKNQTGFHITMGKVNGTCLNFELCPSFVVALFGYRDEKNAGIRFKPSLEELIDFSNFPLAEPGLINSWMSVAFTPLRLTTLPDSAKVVVENSPGERVVTYVNSDEGVSRWLSRQLSTRSFQVLSGSELKKELPPTVEKNGSLVWQERRVVTPVPQLPAHTSTLGPTFNYGRVTPTSPERGRKETFTMHTAGKTMATMESTTETRPVSDVNKLVTIGNLMLMDFRSGRAVLSNVKTLELVNPWKAIHAFVDEAIPMELLIYGMRRLSWELDNWQDSRLVPLTGGVSMAIAQFQEEVKKQIGDPSDAVSMAKEADDKPSAFPFLVGHRMTAIDRGTILDVIENIIDSTSLYEQEHKRLWLQISYMTSLIDGSYPKVLNAAERNRWFRCLNALGHSVLEFSTHKVPA